MRCSLCKQIGHRANSKIFHPKMVLAPVPPSCPSARPTLLTEDVGKMFEMAICLAYGIPYDGKYKYSMDLPQKLQKRLSVLPTLFPKCTHTAKRGARYDFTAVDDEKQHLSAKTTKKGCGMIAPQVVGQAQPALFCSTLGIPFTTVENLKQHIQESAHSILPVLVSYTFDCPNLFYNAETDTIKFIRLLREIDWTGREFTWTCPWSSWKNSTTLKIKDAVGDFVPLLEVQFHSKSRTNMAVRWFYSSFLRVFADSLEIREL